jgi:hypothetical protein
MVSTVALHGRMVSVPARQVLHETQEKVPLVVTIRVPSKSRFQVCPVLHVGWLAQMEPMR